MNFIIELASNAEFLGGTKNPFKPLITVSLKLTVSHVITGRPIELASCVLRGTAPL